MPEISGVDFDDAWPRRVEMPADPGGSVMVPVISAEDLVTNKQAAGRE